MAKTKHYQKLQQQLLVIYLTTCLTVISVLIKVDSVSALDGSGSTLQHHEAQPPDNIIQEHNYIMEKQNDGDDPDEGDGDGSFSAGSSSLYGGDLTRNHLNFESPFKANALVKRIPGGFIGMRGKKIYNDEDANPEKDSNEISYNNLLWNQLQDSNENINWNDYAQGSVRRFKKAPTAFYGVRGKKFTTITGDNSNNDNHRWHEFLQNLEEERLRDAVLQNFVERLTGSKNDLTNDLEKRAPIGFTGVRGKRPFIDELDASTENKRRLGNNAFVGVRGKKDVSHQAFKRSPAGPERYSFGFWKKSLLSGRNGKRQNLNNKFIAVRGKKTLYDDSPSAAISLLYGKRAPNGFVGMRGKRPFTTDGL